MDPLQNKGVIITMVLGIDGHLRLWRGHFVMQLVFFQVHFDGLCLVLRSGWVALLGDLNLHFVVNLRAILWTNFTRLFSTKSSVSTSARNEETGALKTIWISSGWSLPRTYASKMRCMDWGTKPGT